MTTTRHRAAGALLASPTPAPSGFALITTDIDRVLDFFETVAEFAARGLLDKSLARDTFYWVAVCYWSASRDYIDGIRKRPTERTAWADLCELMPRWIAAEGGSPPTPADINTFLEDERGHTPVASYLPST